MSQAFGPGYQFPIHDSGENPRENWYVMRYEWDNAGVFATKIDGPTSHDRAVDIVQSITQSKTWNESLEPYRTLHVISEREYNAMVEKDELGKWLPYDTNIECKSVDNESDEDIPF